MDRGDRGGRGGGLGALLLPETSEQAVFDAHSLTATRVCCHRCRAALVNLLCVLPVMRGYAAAMAPGDHYTWSGWRAWLHALFQRRSASNQAVTDWAGLQPNMDVLDVGCGAGSAVIIAATMLPNGTAVGVDPSADFIKIAKRRSRHAGNVDFVQSTAEDLPFGAETFDVVWSVHSAHHWRDVATGVRETLRVLRPGGRLLIVERLDPKRPWGIGPDQARNLAEVLSAAGFVDVSNDQRRVAKGEEFLITGTHS